MNKKVKVILNDGTEYCGRLFMILRTTKPGRYAAKARKIICLEVGESRNVVRIDDTNIKSVLSL
jgi:hypothetical protein